MTLIENADYFVWLVPLPYAIKGMASPNPDGTFSIYLNSRFGFDLNTMKHELDHIRNNDFYNGGLIQDIEKL